MGKRKPKIDPIQLQVGQLVEQTRGADSPCSAEAIAEDNLLKDPHYYRSLCKATKHDACKLLGAKLKGRARRRKPAT